MQLGFISCFEPQLTVQAGGGGEGCWQCLLRLETFTLTHATGPKSGALRVCRVARHCACSKVAGSCTTVKFSDKETARCLTWKTLTSLCGLRQCSNKLKGKENRIESNTALLFL